MIHWKPSIVSCGRRSVVRSRKHSGELITDPRSVEQAVVIVDGARVLSITGAAEVAAAVLVGLAVVRVARQKEDETHANDRLIDGDLHRTRNTVMSDRASVVVIVRARTVPAAHAPIQGTARQQCSGAKE